MQDLSHRAKLLAAMRWQVEAGADEAVQNTPRNAVERLEGRIASQSVPKTTSA